MLFLLKKIVITEDTTTLKWYWFNKVIWELNNNEIESIKATYFSDTSYRSKKMYFKLRNGIEHQAYIYGTSIEAIAKLYLIKNKPPFFIEKNGKFELYEIPNYN